MVFLMFSNHPVNKFFFFQLSKHQRLSQAKSLARFLHFRCLIRNLRLKRKMERQTSNVTRNNFDFECVSLEDVEQWSSWTGAAAELWKQVGSLDDK